MPRQPAPYCSSFAIVARFLPSKRALSLFCALTRTMLSQPPAASTMFHQPGEPVLISFLRRDTCGRIFQPFKDLLLAAFEGP